MVSLRVRSPTSTRQGPAAATATTGDKRKYSGSNLNVRRSTRGVEAANSSISPDNKVKAKWDGQYLTVSGLPATLLAEDGLAESTATNHHDSDEHESSTWEEKWMESPSKRRRLDRSSHSSSQDPLSKADGAITTGKRRHAPRDGRDDSQERPRPRAIDRLTRAESNAASRRGSRQSTPDQDSRQTSLAPTFASAPDQSPSVSPSKQLEDELGDLDPVSAAPSPAPSLSPEPLPARSARGNGKGKEPAGSEQKSVDELDSSDLPPPFLDPLIPGPNDAYEDEAAQILASLYPPIPLPQRFIQALTAHPPSKRSTATLLALAKNAQRALKCWQDEYVRLDRRTAPVSIPIPKKPCSGGRRPADPIYFDYEKHKELYGDGSKLSAAMGLVHPPKHHAKAGNGTPQDPNAGSGRELRRRGADRHVIDGLGVSSDDAGAKKPTRARKPVRRFDAGQNTTDTTGAAASKVAVSARGQGLRRGRFASANPEETPVPDAAPKRRRRGRVQADRPTVGLEEDAASPEFDDNAAASGALDNSVQPEGDQSSGGAVVGEAERERILVDGQTLEVPTTKAQFQSPAKSQNKRISASDDPETAERKARAKSAKRSESMTAWWAQRKKKLAEEQMKEQHSRGYHEGMWNVDSIKAWGPGAPGMPGMLMPPDGAMASPGAHMDAHWAAYMAANRMDPRSAWMPGMWPPPGGPGAPPFAPYGWPMAPPGAPYDPRMYEQPPPLAPQTQPPPPPDHRQHDPPHHSRRPSMGGPPRTLTPTHPFAQPPTPAHYFADRPPSRQPSPPGFHRQPTRPSPSQTPLPTYSRPPDHYSESRYSRTSSTLPALNSSTKPFYKPRAPEQRSPERRFSSSNFIPLWGSDSRDSGKDDRDRDRHHDRDRGLSARTPAIPPFPREESRDGYRQRHPSTSFEAPFPLDRAFDQPPRSQYDDPRHAEPPNPFRTQEREPQQYYPERNDPLAPPQHPQDRHREHREHRDYREHRDQHREHREHREHRSYHERNDHSLPAPPPPPPLPCDEPRDRHRDRDRHDNNPLNHDNIYVQDRQAPPSRDRGRSSGDGVHQPHALYQSREHSLELARSRPVTAQQPQSGTAAPAPPQRSERSESTVTRNRPFEL